MAKIECNDCGEMIEITASSVSLPYVCGECQRDFEELWDEDFGDFETEDISMEQVLGNGAQDYAGQKYEDMAPAPLEPTEALIADLKAQNERLTARLEGLSEIKATLEQSQKEVKEYQERVDELKDDRDVLLSKWVTLSQAFAKAENIN